MLVAVCSAKGSPGATSLALATTAAWPVSGAVLLEADPSGADLAFRVRHASGREVAATPNTLGLATAVRGGSLDGIADPHVLEEYAQPLACGVHLVPGVAAPAQARGLGSLWPRIAQAAAGAAGDVVADLGRVQQTDPTISLVAAASALVVVCEPSLESVAHARALIVDVASTPPPGTPAGARVGGRLVCPVVIGPHRQGTADAADIDEILGGLGIPIARTVPVAWDLRALNELEAGANPKGRLARTHLMRSVAALAATLVGARQSGSQSSTWEARRG